MLKHINLTVTDIMAAETFLTTYFAVKSLGGSKSYRAVVDENGVMMTLMRDKRNSPVTYPETFHIGFEQESEAKVNEIYERLKADSFDVEPPARYHAWLFYVSAPGGFTVEVMA